ncbi:hypothetical protein I317_00313 [Kwoniella heveanensis CBS 569]|nr:hypothetical protein I317_00313 [Kwoniella heveanensis CBS 569]
MAFTIAMSSSHLPPFQLAPSPISPPQSSSPPASPSPSSSLEPSIRISSFIAPPLKDPSRSTGSQSLPSDPSLVLTTSGETDTAPSSRSSAVRRSFSTRSKTAKKSTERMAPETNRDSLHIDTFTSTLDRDALFSRATSVAAVLRTIGPSKDGREQGVEALCAYVEGKRSKGKKDEEVREKLALLEGMVPTDLGDVFVKEPPPPPLRSQARSRLSVATITSASTSTTNPTTTSLTSPVSSTSASFLYSAPRGDSYDNNEEMEPALPETPITQISSYSISSRMDDTSMAESAPFDWSLSPTDSDSLRWYPISEPDSISSQYPVSRKVSLSRSYAQSATHSDTESSFSAPEPAPYFTQTLVEYSSSISAASTDTDSDSMLPPAALGRAPTLLSPLALGGWGRQWERPLLNRERTLMATSSASASPSALASNTRGDAIKTMEAIDGISLDSFPTPPERSPEALTPPETGRTPWAWSDASPDSIHGLQSPWTQIQTPPAPPRFGGIESGEIAAPVWRLDHGSNEERVGIPGVGCREGQLREGVSSSAGETKDSSWLSISDTDEVPLARLIQAKANGEAQSVNSTSLLNATTGVAAPPVESEARRMFNTTMPVPLQSEDDVPLSILIQRREEEDDLPLAKLFHGNGNGNGISGRPSPVDGHRSWTCELYRGHTQRDTQGYSNSHSRGEKRWSRSDGQDWEWEYEYDHVGGLEDEERTITGVESSRWSAVWSDMSLNEANARADRADQGPTEASRIRDAYLSMIQLRDKTAPHSDSRHFDYAHNDDTSHRRNHGHAPESHLGPEQGDSYTILMAYAQPAPASA